MKFFESLDDPFGNMLFRLIDKNELIEQYETFNPERADLFLAKNALENLPIFAYQNRLENEYLKVGTYDYSTNITKLSMISDISWNETSTTHN
jgi:hypothetical protein